MKAIENFCVALKNAPSHLPDVVGGAQAPSGGSCWQTDEHFYLKWRKLWRHRRSPFGLKSERVARCAFCLGPKVLCGSAKSPQRQQRRTRDVLGLEGGAQEVDEGCRAGSNVANVVEKEP